jgi:hypothetical protein
VLLPSPLAVGLAEIIVLLLLSAKAEEVIHFLSSGSQSEEEFGVVPHADHPGRTIRAVMG